ncbi:hypothetical protein BN1723_016219, partial [Verticillium longisporum]
MSNVLSIYRTVKRLGIPDSQIILMLPDDMACNPRNAFPGTVYSNSDRAVDLYGDNIEVDYRGYEVTVENFIRLMTDRVGAEMPRSKRLLTDERSNILVYMTGHGGNEFLKFQDAEEIGAFDLADAFEQMWEKKRYNEILFMIDTCQANTMYSKLYSPNIIATGSSKLDQSSYSHHADQDVGVAVIDRFTYYNLEFLENQVKDMSSQKTIGELFDSYDFEKIHSHPGVRYDLFKGGADEARSRRITDFFGNVQQVEVDGAKSLALEEELLELSRKIAALRVQADEQDAAARNATAPAAAVPVTATKKIQFAQPLTNDNWWAKKIIGATALAACVGLWVLGSYLEPSRSEDAEDSVEAEKKEAQNGSVKAAKAPAKKAPAAKKPAAKKLTQTTLKTAAAPKKRPVSFSDDEASGLSNTPPSSKKLKKAPAASKSSGNPLAEIENDSMALDEPSAPAPVAKGTKKTVEETYQKLTQLEHIVKRPDTYIGSVERTEMPMWVYNKETQLMEFRKVTTVPGLYKIFDEILVNAADIKVRREESGEEPVTHIKVNIDREAGQISIENNGKGIPVEMHKQHGIYPKAKETLPKFADSSDFSDGDLTSMSAKKKKPSASVEPEAEPVIGGRTKRAAAAKARPVFDLSESDASDNDFGDVGDIGQMVHGYKSTKTDSSKELKNGRLSLHGMNRPESSHGAREAALPKLKSKPSRHILDDDSHDETNYEALAVRSSPHKPVASKDDDLEEFLSDDSVPAR